MQRSLLISNPNQIVLTKQRGALKSVYMRPVSMINTNNVFRQSNGKQLKYNYQTIKLQKKQDIKQSDDKWYSSDTHQYGYRLVMKEESGGNDLCLYFVSREEAERNYYNLVAQGMMREKMTKLWCKEIFKNVGIELRKNIAHNMIGYMNIKMEEEMERSKIEQEKMEYSSRIEKERKEREDQSRRIRQQEQQRRSRETKLIEERNAEMERLAEIQRQKVRQRTRQIEQERERNRLLNRQTFIFVVNSIRLNRQVLPEQLNLKITICQQIYNVPLVPTNQSKQYIIYLPASPLRIVKPTEQINFNSRLQISVQSTKGSGVCGSVINSRELVYNNKFGLSVSIPMFPKKQIDYKKSSNKQLEDLHAQQCYPFLIDIEIFQKYGSFDTLDKLRSNLLSTNYRAIPNQFGINYHIQKWSQSRIYAYQKYLNISPEASQLSLNRISNVQKALIKQFQKQQNKSVGSSKIGAKYAIINPETLIALLNTKNSAHNSLKIAQKGIEKARRLDTYESLLKIGDPKAGASLSFNQIDFADDLPNAFKNNLEEDYKAWIQTKLELQSNQQARTKAKSKCQRVKKVLILYLSYKTLSIHKTYYYNSSLLPLASRIIDLVESSLRFKQIEVQDAVIIKRSFWLLLSFISRVSPYFSISSKTLAQDIRVIRSSLQSYMSNYNIKLNSQFKTLNKIAEKMLNLWSDQHPEFTFRLWDILVYSCSSASPIHNIIPYIAITYLKHWETNGEIQVVNINQFISNLFKNTKLLKIPDIPQKIESTNALQQVKKTLKPFSNFSLIYRMMFPLQLQFPQQQPIPSVQSDWNKRLAQINPTFRKSDPVCINIMAKRIKIYNNIGVAPYKLIINHYCTPKISYVIYEGLDKFVFPNHYLKLQQNGLIDIQIFSGRTKLRSDKLNLFSGKYDQLEKIHIRLFQIQNNSSYTSESDCEIVLIKQSPHHQFSTVNIKKNIQQKQFKRKISLKTLEHPGVQAINRLQNIFENLKQPLDSFSAPYKNLKLSNNNTPPPDWFQNSQLSLNSFRQTVSMYSFQNNQQLLTKLFNISFQHFKIIDKINTSRFIIFLILLCQCDMNTKLDLLFQLILKYQTTLNKQITYQSLNFLLKQVSNFYGIEQNLHLPSISIVNSTLSFQNKSHQSKDITSLISNWCYNCYKQYNSLDILLGTADSLLLLQSILSQSDVVRVREQNGCSISITYKTQRSVHIWSVVVDGEFNIVRRGEKQGSVYPQYTALKNPTCRVELLHNYQNVIPLTPSQPISKQRFKEIICNSVIAKYFMESEIGHGIIERSKRLETIHIYKDGIKNMEMPMLKQYSTVQGFKRMVVESIVGDEMGYQCSVLVETVVITDLNTHFSVIESILKTKNHIEIHFCKQSSENIVDEIQQQVIRVKNLTFGDLAIIRYQNSITNWRSCRILEQTQNNYKVIFEHIPEKYFTLAKHEVLKISYQ